MTKTWITNDPQAAAAFTAADSVYEAAKRAAESLWPLAAKVEALRIAKCDKQAAYEAVLKAGANA